MPSSICGKEKGTHKRQLEGLYSLRYSIEICEASQSSRARRYTSGPPMTTCMCQCTPQLCHTVIRPHHVYETQGSATVGYGMSYFPDCEKATGLPSNVTTRYFVRSGPGMAVLSRLSRSGAPLALTTLDDILLGKATDRLEHRPPFDKDCFPGASTGVRVSQSEHQRQPWFKLNARSIVAVQPPFDSTCSHPSRSLHGICLSARAWQLNDIIISLGR